MEEKYILIVSGVKLLPDGNIDPRFKERLRRARHLLNRHYFDAVVISGGVTRKGFPSEASVGAQNFNGRMSDYWTVPVFLEERATSSYENLLYSKELCANESSLRNCMRHYTIEHSNVSVWRFCLLAKQVWPFSFDRISFVLVDDTRGLRRIVALLKEILSLSLTLIDPKEKSFLRKFFKTRLRNKQVVS